MAKHVEAGGQVIEFPDEMSDDQIGEVLRKQFPPTQSTAQKKSVGGFVSNLYESGKKQLGAVADIVMHPVDTYEAVKPAIDMAGSVLSSNGPGMVKAYPKAKRLAAAILEDYGKAYGGMDATLETLYNDPFRVLGDVATLAGGAGAITKGAGMSRTANALAATERVASAVQPVNAMLSAPGAMAKAGAKLLPKTAPREVYRSALQPPVMAAKNGVDGAERANNMIDLAVEGQYMPGKTAPVEQRMNELNRQREAALQAADASGVTIDPRDALNAVDDLRAQTALSDDPGTALATLDNMKARAEAKYTDPTTGAVQQVTPSEAQAIKEANYGRSRYTGSKGSMKGQGLKQFGRGWKEQLDAVVPELKSINPEWAGLKDLYSSFDKFAQKPHGASPGQVGAAGVVGTMAMGPGGGMALAGLREALSVPAIKAKLAFALDKAKREGFKSRGGSEVPQVVRISDILRRLDERDQQEKENQ